MVDFSMDRNPSGLLFSLCIDGFVKYKTAEGLSQRTVDSYEWVLRKWMEKIGDQPVGKITSADVLDYMTYLRTEYVPPPSTRKILRMMRQNYRSLIPSLTEATFWLSRLSSTPSMALFRSSSSVLISIVHVIAPNHI